MSSRRKADVGSSGRLVASVLSGSWRPKPPPLALSVSALAEVTPLLLRTGAASLGWNRIRYSSLHSTAEAFPLQQAYRFHTLEASVHEQRLVQVIERLHSSGVDPLLAKGWAAARFYPEPGLRPYGDIDLWVRPKEFGAAVSALRSPDAPVGPVDLHREFRDLDRSWAEVYQRSVVLRVGECEVRTLGLEDHLRLLCRHLLYHGAWRPLWLCDIGALLESLSDDFDWKYCLAGDSRCSDGVNCAIGLAFEVLGTQVSDSPMADRGARLPRWLVPSVIRQWSLEEHYMHSPSMAYCLRHPSHLLKALRLRWPDPIQATVRVGGPFNQLPRLPFQLAECVRRSLRFRRSPGFLTKRS